MANRTLLPSRAYVLDRGSRRSSLRRHPRQLKGCAALYDRRRDWLSAAAAFGHSGQNAFHT